MHRVLLALALILAPVVVQAQSPTIRDIVELTKAGLSEEVILALIDVHGAVFPSDAETLKQLKSAGVSPNVIVAVVKSGRERPVVAPEPPAAPEQPSAQPPVVVIEHHSEPRVREVAVPVPVYVPVPMRRVHRDYEYPREPVRRAEPVYWGWGGKLRPDAWKPSPEHGRERYEVKK